MLAETLSMLASAIEGWQRRQHMALPHADCSAVLTINAGAGGTDAQARTASQCAKQP